MNSNFLSGCEKAERGQETRVEFTLQRRFWERVRDILGDEEQWQFRIVICLSSFCLCETSLF